jgi:predicted phosphate transport protein (TIGR00153 family)
VYTLIFSPIAYARKGELAVFRFPFIPRQENFFNLFEQSAQNVSKSAQLLKELVYGWDNIEGRVGEIAEMEDKGDSITHQIMEQLNRTFVTPFDREDIALLAHSLDDIIDFIDATADAMLIYKIDKPTPRAQELADNIVESTAEVERAIPQLRRRSDLKKMLPHCVEINRLENAADKIFRAAIAELFDETEDIAQVIKWREIYEHMESATDRCEDVSNVLEGVALKYA